MSVHNQIRQIIRNPKCEIIMIIITGIGRSGTSFTAKVLCEAGAALKGDWYDETVKAGMECPKTVRINELLRLGAASSFDEAVCQAGVGDIKSEFQDGVIIKDPKFMQTLDFWIESGINIEHIIYCSRDYREIYDSAIRSGCGNIGGVTGIYTFHGAQVYCTHLERIFFRQAAFSNIPVTTIYFPKSVKDFSEMEKLSFIAGRENLKNAWEKTRNQSKVSANANNIADVNVGEKLTELLRKVGRLERQLSDCENMGPLRRLERDVRRKVLYPLKKRTKKMDKAG